MPIPQLTVHSILKMAHAEAQRLSNAPIRGHASEVESPDLRDAVAQVWSMVRVQLGQDRRVEELDRLIALLTTTTSSVNNIKPK